ncbi:helix-turn-helix domain-containing protein [Cohnella algarum]|uniref:helix-turn-helix domain-containing protein n=1 Tax=Cohnella algarum TaxID=2044859 RepID=UPI001966E7FA|nr:helix-turn-helix domain-containing protein [Cohnella algarum]MBN2982528.1 helix-turn-helix domain-containing protein [Cohnella algarum]
MDSMPPDTNSSHHSLLFTWEGTSSFQDPAMGIACRTAAHEIFVFAEGSGLLKIDDVPCAFRQGTALVLPPDCSLEWGCLDGNVAGYRVGFRAYQLGGRAPAGRLGEFLPYKRPIDASPGSRLDGLLDELAETAEGMGDEDGVQRFKREVRLQELLLLLLEKDRSNRRLGNGDAASAVKKTAAYLEEHYREEITVERLARLANVARWQYSALFQAETGKKPLDYLNDIRMNRAKELLLRTDEPLREIARSTGFKDEYYFNRRFRQTLGISPRQYAKLHRREERDTTAGPLVPAPAKPSRIVAVGYGLGEMIALGIRPVGADMTVIGRQVVYRSELQNIADVGPLGDLAAIRRLEPDLILHCSVPDESMRSLSGLARTIFIEKNWHPYERLRRIAELFGKTRQAEQWIRRCEARTGQMWARLRPEIGSRETASVFLLLSGQLYVMGQRGLATTLYHPLAFRPPVRIAEMIEEQITFRSIALEQLPGYAGDRVFLLVGEDAASAQALVKLANSEIWLGLDAVRNGFAYVSEAHWNYDDPITKDRLFPVLPVILGRSS